MSGVAAEEEWWDDRGYEDAAGALFGAQLRPIPMSEELEDVFQSMYALRQEFEHLPRPQGLPPLGEPLPTTEQVCPLPPLLRALPGPCLDYNFAGLISDHM